MQITHLSICLYPSEYVFQFVQEQPPEYGFFLSLNKLGFIDMDQNSWTWGTVCFQIGQIFLAQWVLEEFWNRRYFSLDTQSIAAICQISRLTVPRIIDQFVHKRCQKKNTTLYKSFFPKHLVYMDGRLSKIRSFWLNKYLDIGLIVSIWNFHRVTVSSILV